MLSAKSFFNPTLFKKNITRFWPLWAIYLVILVVTLPANLLVNYRSDVENLYASQNFATAMPFEVLQNLGIPLSAVMSIFAAMAVFSYLCNSRSACLMHTLPMRREGLFLTNYLSGLSFFVLPNLLVYLLTLIAEAISGYVDLGALSLWLLGMTLLPLFFYSFGVFCAMFSGHLLALPAFYGVLNWLGLMIAELISYVLSTFIYGFTSNSSITFLGVLGTWFTPVWKLYLCCMIDYVWSGDGAVSYVQFDGLPYLFLYAGIGILFAIAALLLYRRRRMERAGDVVTVTALRPVFKYGFAFCAALSLGSLLYAIFEDALPKGAWTLLGFMLLCGAIGYFAAEMLLQKSFRVFSKWKGCVVCLLCLTAATAVMEYDLFGYERRIPAAADVASVTLSTPYSAPNDSGTGITLNLTDPALIEQLISIHADIVAQKDSIEASFDNYNTYYDSYTSTSETGLNVQTAGSASLTVSYTLKTGQVITRSYNVPITSEALEDPDSYASHLQSLISSSSVAMDTYFFNMPKFAALSSAEISYYDSKTQSFSSLNFGTADTAALYQAVCADLNAGNLGQRYLLEDKERFENCYYNDITFYFNVPASDISSSGNYSYSTSSQQYSITVTLQSSAVNTLAVLSDDITNGLITMEEYQSYSETGSFYGLSTIESAYD